MVVDIVRELKQQNPRLVYGRQGPTLGSGWVAPHRVGLAWEPGKGRLSLLPHLHPSMPHRSGTVSYVCQASEDVGLLKSTGLEAFAGDLGVLCGWCETGRGVSVLI